MLLCVGFVGFADFVGCITTFAFSYFTFNVALSSAIKGQYSERGGW